MHRRNYSSFKNYPKLLDELKVGTIRFFASRSDSLLTLLLTNVGWVAIVDGSGSEGEGGGGWRMAVMGGGGSGGLVGGGDVIMEYLVKISKKARILDLKRRYLKITVLTFYTPYPLRKIRRICTCTSQKTTKDSRSIHRIQKESIRRIQFKVIKYSGRYRAWSLLQETPDTSLEEEKARRRSKVYNWKTATYGKIWYDDDIHDLRSVETEFPAIVFNDELTSEEALSCEPTVSSLNDNEIDFRVSFDESEDEDCTVIFNKKSFSYKIISVDNLKTDLENNNKVDMPSFPSPEPTVSYFNNLDFLKDFEKEFSTIVYNDAPTEPTISPQHIDEFDLKDETSLSEYDEKEQNILYFNDLFPFNIIYPDDLKADKENDDNEIDIIQSSGGILELVMVKWVEIGNTFSFSTAEAIRHIALHLEIRDRFEGLGYTDADITNFEERLGRIYGREIHKVQVFDFEGLTELMAEGLSGRMLMEHMDAHGQSIFTSRAWRRLFKIRGPFLGGVRRRMSWREFILGMGLHTAEEIESVGVGAYWAESVRQIPDKGDLSAYWVGISSVRNFLGTTPSYTSIRDPMLRLCHRLIACRRYLRLFASGRKRRAMISGGQFVARLAEHFGLLTEERLHGLTQVVAVGTPVVAEDTLVLDEGALAVLEPAQVPQAPPTAGPAKTMAQRLARLEEDVHGIRGALGEQREARVRYTSYSDYHIPYVRHTRRRTDDASTSAPQQPDP
ncbi:hypothetical protein Tco_1008863 [Tanacetum coccineum]